MYCTGSSVEFAALAIEPALCQVCCEENIQGLGLRVPRAGTDEMAHMENHASSK